ncbi:MAG: protein phosphatase 2C domain-containing protein, partial [Verrucomicrobia bacterium]|nr:protein phosphatase 2C domain-containing protein [Verrucomicrobiota bacterium]
MVLLNNNSVQSHQELDPLTPLMAAVSLEPKLGPKNAHCFAMTSLPTDCFSRLPAALIDYAKELGSQGFYVSPDGSCAYSHETSYPLSFFLKDKTPCIVNMDRGGVVSRPDGSVAACVADGVSGGGYFSAFVAHMVSDYLLRAFSDKSLPFTDDAEANKKIAQELFAACGTYTNNLSEPTHCRGQSTVLFAECIPVGARDGKKVYCVQVAALGDGAAFCINGQTQKVTQLNTITRVLNSQGKQSVNDTGGCIHAHGFIESKGNTSTARWEALEGDYIVLATDGLLDNARDEKVEELIQYIAFNPFFDRPFEELVKYPRTWEKGYEFKLPTIEEISHLIECSTGSPVSFDLHPTAEQITKRLANYIKLV